MQEPAFFTVIFNYSAAFATNQLKGCFKIVIFL